MWITALSIDAKGILSGEVALDVAPGTVARAQTSALDEALGAALNEAAAAAGCVVAAAPSRFARPLPGKDDEGRTHFAVRGRFEGGCLIPARPEKR